MPTVGFPSIVVAQPSAKLSPPPLGSLPHHSQLLLDNPGVLKVSLSHSFFRTAREWSLKEDLERAYAYLYSHLTLHPNRTPNLSNTQKQQSADLHIWADMLYILLGSLRNRQILLVFSLRLQKLFLGIHICRSCLFLSLTTHLHLSFCPFLTALF